MIPAFFFIKLIILTIKCRVTLTDTNIITLDVSLHYQSRYNSMRTSHLFQRLLLSSKNNLQVTKLTVQLKLQSGPHLVISS